MKRSIIFYLCLFFSSSASAQVTYYKDIRPVIERSCVDCHSTKGISFSFEEPEQTLLFKEAIVSAVASKRMPPWLAEAGHQTYIDDESLTNETRQKFTIWKRNGFLKGIPNSVGESLSAPVPQEKFNSNLTINLLPDKKYLPNQTRKDDYRCFVVEWPKTEQTYVTGFKAIPGNLKVAHHLVAFVIEPEVAKLIKHLDRQESGPGYQCFGGAIPDRLNDEKQQALFESKYPNGLQKLQRNNFWLAHWAPGMDGYSFPKDTGIRIRPGSLIILQMHYYSAFAPGEADSNTKVEFQIADRVAQPAMNFPLTSNQWLNAQNNRSMVIPPGKEASFKTKISFQKIASQMARILKISHLSIESLVLHSANIHMHSYGSSGRSLLTYHNGEKETLLSIPRWDLDWQRDFTFTTPKTIESNRFHQTELNVECDYVNPTTKNIYGGYGSDDEMCFNFSYISVDLLNDSEQLKMSETSAN